ncbi:MAG: transposase [Bryobacteraceae bacterium]|nr:transposase [Bryobacteraceae bacterium]
MELTRSKVRFVTRLKDNAEYGVVETRPAPPGSDILRDEVILLTKTQEAGPDARLRRIEDWADDKGESMVFVTNHMKLSAYTIAQVSRQRWQIELLFKSLNQSLRIKTFIGTSANAVMIQIGTALMAMLLVRRLQLQATHGRSLSNLIALCGSSSLCTVISAHGSVRRSCRRQSPRLATNSPWRWPELDSSCRGLL